MLKKKVSIKTKDHSIDEIKPSRGRPKSRAVDTPSIPKLPSSRVFSVGIESSKSTSINRTNNIIRLKLKISNITKLEKYISENKDNILLEDTWSGLNDDWISYSQNSSLNSHSLPMAPPQPQHPHPQQPQQHQHQHQPPPQQISKPTFTGLEGFVKRRTVETVPLSQNQPVPPQQTPPSSSRKDLIINSGVKRTSSEPLQIFSDTWPLTSPYACWYCCHTFDTTPVGIPAILTNYTFRCYGNFCSYNCAKRYLCPLKDDEDDMACMQSSNDIFRGDDHGEKLQLLELLYHLETGSDMDEPIKTAPRRLILKTFGGNKTIEEFRQSFNTNTTYHTFKMPLASMAYHMEECTDTKSDARRKFKNMSLDVSRLEQAYENLMKEHPEHLNKSLL